MNDNTTVWVCLFAISGLLASGFAFALGYVIGRSKAHIRYVNVTEPVEQSWWTRWWYGPTSQASLTGHGDQAPQGSGSQS